MRKGGNPQTQSNNFTFQYDALSRRTQLTRPNGINTNYSYDNLSRLLSVLHQVGSTTVDGASYTYDNAGNRIAKTNHLNGIAENYGYDNIYQLLQVTEGATTTESYTYDRVGNRLSALGMSPYTYNSSNQLTSTPTATYTYDNNGNTGTKVDATGTTTYSWDYENRLKQVTLPGTGGTVTFKYDPFGRRAQKAFTQGGTTTTTNYLYDGVNIIEEVDNNGVVLAWYTQGAGVDEQLSELRANTTSFYEVDGLGSITSLSNGTGALTNTYTYDNYGEPTGSTGTLVNPFRYTGREFDQEAGLNYYRMRYYDQNVGRFISEDPTRFGGGTNFYDYAAGNPVYFTDPMGLAPTGLSPGLSPWTAAEEAAYQVFVQGLQGTSNFLSNAVAGGIGILYLINPSGGNNDRWAQSQEAQYEQAAGRCKKNNNCKPCIPPVGTRAYREDTSPSSPPHRGVPTPHWHVYEMNQNPINCKCFWKKIPDNQGGFGGSPPPPGMPPITPAGGGGPA